MKFLAPILIGILMCLPLFAFTPDSQTSHIAVSGAVASVQVANPQFHNYSVITTVSVPANGVFTCVSGTDLCASAEGYATGLMGTMATTGTLPGGLTTSVNYWLIQSGSTNFKVAATSGGAVAGTAIDITSIGTGVHTFVPVALSGGSMKLQGSMDGTNWADLPIKASGDATKSITISGAGSYELSENNLSMNYIRPYYIISGGQMNIIQSSKVK
jgi:hypothetical protein